MTPNTKISTPVHGPIFVYSVTIPIPKQKCLFYKRHRNFTKKKMSLPYGVNCQNHVQIHRNGISMTKLTIECVEGNITARVTSAT